MSSFDGGVAQMINQCDKPLGLAVTATKISVIVPVYKVEKYLQRCLDSLVAQTLREIEVICVDDCSPDASGEILEEYARKDPRIRVVHRENGGLSAARNSGLEVATGRYAMFCDSDDYVDADWCERLYRAVEENGAELGVCNVSCESDDEPLRRRMQGAFASHKDSVCGVSRRLLLSSDVSVWDKIYRRDLIVANGLTFFEGLHHEDEFFFWSYMRFVYTVAYSGSGCYHYVLRDDSIMGQERQGGVTLDYLVGSIRLLRDMDAASDYCLTYVKGVLPSVKHVVSNLPEGLLTRGFSLARELAGEIAKKIDVDELNGRERAVYSAMLAEDSRLVTRKVKYAHGLFIVKNDAYCRIVSVLHIPVLRLRQRY